MIKEIKSNRRSPFNLQKHLISQVFLSILLVSCSSLPQQSNPNALVSDASLKALKPIIEKIFTEEAPILPVSLSQFPLVNQLPGRDTFTPYLYRKNSIADTPNGALLLSPGDYSIPVMTYCMKVTGASPPGFSYVLASLKGSRANIIREINLKATHQFSSSDIQILSWSLQAGLNYDELTTESQHIIDTTVPKWKNDIKESFLQRITDEWNQFSDRSDGIIPSFEDIEADLLAKLGDVGKMITQMRDFRDSIAEYGNDYSRLHSLINTEKNSAPRLDNTNKTRNLSE